MIETGQINVNDVYLPYLNCDKRIQIFYGGSSSGKSFFLAQRTVLDNLKGMNYLICRNVANTIRKSIFNEIVKGNDTRKEFFEKIIEVQTLLGGDLNDVI